MMDAGDKKVEVRGKYQYHGELMNQPIINRPVSVFISQLSILVKKIVQVCFHGPTATVHKIVTESMQVKFSISKNQV